MKSKLFKIDAKDLIHGLIVAVITSLVTGFYQIVQAGGELSWIVFKPVVIASVGAGLSYLVKNLLSNSDGQFLTAQKPLNQGGGNLSGTAHRYKRNWVILILLTLGMTANAQNIFSGVFKPVPKDLLQSENKSITASGSSYSFLIRPTVELTAVEITKSITPGQKYNVNALNSMGAGFSIQHFTEANGEPYNDFGVNFVAMFNVVPDANTGLNVYPAVTFNFLNIVSAGVGYNSEIRKATLLWGVALHFNK